jgi:hypothetical protein
LRGCDRELIREQMLERFPIRAGFLICVGAYGLDFAAHVFELQIAEQAVWGRAEPGRQAQIELRSCDRQVH